MNSLDIEGILEEEKVKISIDENGVIARITPFNHNKDLIIKPRTVNLHMHLGESIFLNLPSLSLSEYLKYGDEYFLKNADLYRKETEILTGKLAEGFGIRAALVGRSIYYSTNNRLSLISGYPLMNSPKLSGYLNNFIERSKSYQAVWVHSLDRIDEDTITQLSSLKGKILTIHINETIPEIESSYKRYGITPIERLYEAGLLTEKTILANCNYLTDKEIMLIKKANAIVAISPVSSLWLKNRLPPIEELLENKIRVNISTDGLATGRTFSQYKQLGILCKAKGIILEEVEACITSGYGVFEDARIEEGAFANLMLLDKDFNPKLNIVGNDAFGPDYTLLDRIKEISEKTTHLKFKKDNWPYTALCIDWGNTLVDFEKSYNKCATVLAEYLNKKFNTNITAQQYLELYRRVKEMRGSYNGDIRRHRWGEFEKELLNLMSINVDNKEIVSTAKEMHSISIDYLEYKDALDLFRFSQSLGMKNIVVSNANTEKLRAELAKSPFKDMIFEIIDSESVGGDKKTKLPFMKLSKYAKLNEVIMIGDRKDEDGIIEEFGGLFIKHNPKNHNMKKELQLLQELYDTMNIRTDTAIM